MLQLPEKRTIYLLVGVATVVGLLLFPAGLITLGAGVALGHKGSNWLHQKKEAMSHEDRRR